MRAQGQSDAYSMTAPVEAAGVELEETEQKVASLQFRVRGPRLYRPFRVLCFFFFFLTGFYRALQGVNGVL